MQPVKLHTDLKHQFLVDIERGRELYSESSKNPLKQIHGKKTAIGLKSSKRWPVARQIRQGAEDAPQGGALPARPSSRGRRVSRPWGCPGLCPPQTARS